VSPRDLEPSGLSGVAGRLQQLVTLAVRDGIGPLTGAVAYAEDRLRRYDGDSAGPALDRDPDDDVRDAAAAPGSKPAEQAIDRIVWESVLAAGANGFVTGIGGIVATGAMLPANIVGNLVVNARMVGAIAHLRGYELDDPHVRTVITLVVAGSSAQSAVSTVGVKLSEAAGLAAIRSIPISALRAINRRASMALVAKYGTKRSAITLVRAVPFVGGLAGGGVDAAVTRGVAAGARSAFPAIERPATGPTPSL